MAKATADLETETVVEPVAVPSVNSDLVSITVTKFGDGKVSTGQHVAGEGDIYAARGERLMVGKSVAESLEARGLAETD